MSVGTRRIAACTFLCAALLWSSVFAVSAWEWPSENLEVVLGFGQTIEGGGFSSGVLLAGEDETVRAAHEGELVLRYSERAPIPGQLTHPLGNFVIAEHGRNFRAVYGHMESMLSEESDPLLSAGASLGAVGTSGYATERGLLLQIRDRERDAYVNPQVMLPQRPDATAPVLQSLSLRSEQEGPIVQISDAEEITAGAVSFYVTAYDLSSVAGVTRRIAPFRIDLELDGSPADTIQYETVTATESGHELDGRVGPETAGPDGWQLYAGTVELDAGTYPVSVTVSDFAGNQASVGGSVTVASAE